MNPAPTIDNTGHSHPSLVNLPDTTDWSEIMMQVREQHRLLNLSNHSHWSRNEKYGGLKSLGWSEEACDEACRPKGYSYQERMEGVAKASKAHQKELKKINAAYRAEARKKLCPNRFIDVTLDKTKGDSNTTPNNYSI